MFVIAGASGNTGSVVARTLLQHRQPVRVIVRSKEKGDSWRAHGAEVAEATIEDVESLARALRGAAGAYLLLPPDYAAPDYMERGQRLSENLAQAVEKSGVRHVTLLSSVGAQHESGTGIVRTLCVAEQRLGKLGVGLTALRAAYFMENWGSALGTALKDGVIFNFLTPPERKIPMVATHDIGSVAAWTLMLPASGHRVIELDGPAEYSPNDVAETLGRQAGRPVAVNTLPLPAMAGALQGFGMSKDMAESMAELTGAISSGHASFSGKGAHRISGTTTLEHVLGAMLKGGGSPGGH